MTIAEKLTKIADNEQKVYDAGYERGYHDGEIVGGGSYDEAFAEGKQAEYDAFWKAYQNNGTRDNYQYGAFGGDGWVDELFKPKYKIKAKYNYQMFYGCRLTEILDIDFSEASDMQSTFSVCYYLEHIGEIAAIKSKNNKSAFHACKKLKTIDKLIVNSAATFDSTFYQCEALENITIEGEIGNDINFQWSTKLKAASIESIVNHLSDTVSGKTLTLSKTAADTAFPCWYENENGEWVNVGCGANGEWLELIAPKVENGKWIIDLV
jgi:hypothetical protein